MRASGALRLLPAALAVGLVLAVFGPLLLGAIPVSRDLPFFHLPLRLTFTELSGEGLPLWNPRIHGGQPILSNPNYAAFYPPSWLVRLVGLPHFFGCFFALHGLLACLGAWWLLGRLGAAPPARALASVAYFAGGAFLSSTNTLNPFAAMAWLPWILGAALAALERESGWGRPAAAAAAGLALQLLAGAPEVALMTLIALGALALDAPWRRWHRILSILVLATTLASIQLIPTALRLADSPRAQGLDVEEALAWSMPPSRLVELAYPHFFGNPARRGEDLFFGWGVHDRNFPYVPSLYPGLLILCLAAAGLASRRIPHRRGWSLAAAAGLLLALGRHDPVHRWALEQLPALAVIRYPEKFVLLTTTMLAVAGALAWDQLLREPRGAVSRIPRGVALLVLGGAAALVALLSFFPQVGADFVAEHSGMRPPVDLQAKGLAFLRGQASISLAIAGLCALLLFSVPRIPPRWLALAAVVLLAGDLLWHGRGSTPSLPAAELLRPPATVADRTQPGQRVFSPSFLRHRDELLLRREEPGTVALRSRLERLDPYVANLWGLQYVVHSDFDRMATGWARHVERSLASELADQEATERFLGAWDVAWWLEANEIDVLLRDRLAGREPRAAELRANPHRRDRYRLPLQLRFHPRLEDAIAAARTDDYDVARIEHCVGEAAPDHHRPAGAKILDAAQRGGSIRIRYSSPGPVFVVAAVSFDRGWRGRVDGESVALSATALGQIAARVPAGESTLELRYHQPGLAWGAATTALGSLLVLFLVLRIERFAPLRSDRDRAVRLR